LDPGREEGQVLLPGSVHCRLGGEHACITTVVHQEKYILSASSHSRCNWALWGFERREVVQEDSKCLTRPTGRTESPLTEMGKNARVQVCQENMKSVLNLRSLLHIQVEILSIQFYT